MWLGLRKLTTPHKYSFYSTGCRRYGWSCKRRTTSESLRRVTSQSETERGMHAYKKNLYVFALSHFGNYFGMVGLSSFGPHTDAPAKTVNVLRPIHDHSGRRNVRSTCAISYIFITCTSDIITWTDVVYGIRCKSSLRQFSPHSGIPWIQCMLSLSWLHPCIEWITRYNVVSISRSTSEIYMEWSVLSGLYVYSLLKALGCGIRPNCYWI